MKEIKAKDGHYLTQSADVAKEDRIFITAIKGASINESAWREATAEEKEEFETEMSKKEKEELETEMSI